MKKLIEFARAHESMTVVVFAVVIGLLICVAVSMERWWHGHTLNKQDAQIQKSIDANSKAAETSETNANTHRDDREQAEGRARLADEQREQARANSNRALDPVRKARQRYEETRRTRTADSPVLSDDQLCAELTKRGIDCR